MKQRLKWSEKLLSIVTRIRPGEGKPTFLLILNAFLLLYSHYLLKVVRETLILTNGSALDKSLATALSAITVGVLAVIYTIFYRRYSDSKNISALTSRVNGFFLVNILIFMLLLAFGIRTPIVFYIWQSVYGLLLVSHFWSYCADLMNQKTGQRLFPPIMVGATLGAWIGSWSAESVFTASGLFGVLSSAFACLLLATYLSRRVENQLPKGSHSKGELIEQEVKAESEEKLALLKGFKLIFSRPYLTYIALFVVLMNWVNSTGEFVLATYIQEAAAAQVLQEPSLNLGEIITGYYSSYYTGVSLLGFLLQTFVVARLFRIIGVRGSILILPIVMVLGYGLLAALPLFIVARWSLLIENSTSYSVANTTRNALFLPLSRDEKYLAKTTIDTFFWRVGDLLQYAVIYIGVNWLAWQSLSFIWLNLFLSVLMLLVCWQIGKQYRHKTRESQAGNAPTLIGVAPNFDLQSGLKFNAVIDEELFFDPDPGDALRYRLTMEKGLSLPSWIIFDSHNLNIHFAPPKDHQDELLLVLAVTDADELGCEALIKVRCSESMKISENLIRI